MALYTNTNCPRLLDYYFVVSCNTQGKQQFKKRLAVEPLPIDGSRPQFSNFALKPTIVDQYPKLSSYPLLPWVDQASMPRGVRARTLPPPPKFMTFTGWNTDGAKLFGGCLEVYEKMVVTNVNDKSQSQIVYIPKTLGFLSHHPFFYVFEVFLQCLWRAIPQKAVRLEDLLCHLFYQIPVAIPGNEFCQKSCA